MTSEETLKRNLMAVEASGSFTEAVMRLKVPIGGVHSE